jgi:hypothetical protein
MCHPRDGRGKYDGLTLRSSEAGRAQDVVDRQLRERSENHVSLAKVRSARHLVRDGCADDASTLGRADAQGESSNANAS